MSQIKTSILPTPIVIIIWAVDGMEDMEFTESDANCSDLVAEYQTREKGDSGDTDME